ncbi:MAG: AAA family ATPase, partial [bacterium]|nr:AAA family ATPase [bacterium]
DYFTINRPRQYGKTTMLHLLEQRLAENKEYLVLGISFEEIDAQTYKEQELFIDTFLAIVCEQLEYLGEKQLAALLQARAKIVNFKQLDLLITKVIAAAGRKVVMIIDEVDKAGNNQLFLDFLGMLRSKYLKRNQGKGHTFHSVSLAGVHDVKTLKSKVRREDEKMYNSPWNIAVDFNVDLSLSVADISSMLKAYAAERDVKMDVPLVAERLFYFTSGYPFLVSLLCKVLDEEITGLKEEREWQKDDLLQAVRKSVIKENTNFETLIKNLENNPELYDFVFEIIMNEREFSYNLHNPLIHLGVLHGVLKKKEGRVGVHNRLYEQIIYNYMASKLETAGHIHFHHVSSSYIEKNGTLSIEKIIRKFQQFMREQYSVKDIDFLERNGRLLFLAFLRPIINGKGFDFKEVQISEEKRLDIVVTLQDQKYIIELKIWRGESYHQAGITQLSDYLERQGQDTGYLLIFDLRKESGQVGEYRTIESSGKKIFAAWV